MRCGTVGTSLSFTGIGLPDATPESKGAVRLAGDLGGTADFPLVPGLVDKADREHEHDSRYPRIVGLPVIGQVIAWDGEAWRPVDNNAHAHSMAQVAGLLAALTGKQAAGSYAPAVHTHTAGNITSGVFAPARLGTGGAGDPGTLLHGDGVWRGSGLEGFRADAQEAQRLAEVAQQAAEDASTQAQQSASGAAQSASTAQTAQGVATGAATEAGTARDESEFILETLNRTLPLPAFRYDLNDPDALIVSLFHWQLAPDDPNALLVTVGTED